MIVLDRERMTLLDAITRRMLADGAAGADVRAAVDVLTASANARRADRLAVRAGEPPSLVERLTVWALHRSSDDAVAEAARLLEDGREAIASLPLATEPAGLRLSA